MKNKVIIFPLLIVATFFLTKFWSSSNKDIEKAVSVVPIVVDTPNWEYGLMIDSFNVSQGEIEPNQFLADILLKHKIPYTKIDQLVKESKDVFDVRKICAGKKYCVLTDKEDTAQQAKYFIYEKNPVEYVIFDLEDSIKVEACQREITTSTKMASGIIESSLYQTLVDQELPVELAMNLADLYAWTIDFYRIQSGDEFQVVYEEKSVDGTVVGLGEITAANFVHNNEPFYAFRFGEIASYDYYDENGQSMRKAFLKAPVKFSRISSRYSLRRFHPVQKRYKSHLGTDYAAPHGTPIMATGDGEIIEARYKKYNGNYVKVKHNSTYTTQYLHMSKIAKGMKPGKMVRQGDVIGYVGSTGLATGPHVCYRFWKNGKQVDPFKQKFPASKPIPVEDKDQFEIFKNEYKAKLDSLKPKNVAALKTSTSKGVL
ncbi:MAG: peptidoglycan DD-metalloendopeptidase family protein [Flavobacteriales bacterium]|nr:peptidoglycan DD-metalloendopeptidase family protein [Flavobacteriales bacterium]